MNVKDIAYIEHTNFPMKQFQDINYQMKLGGAQNLHFECFHSYVLRWFNTSDSIDDI
jgi:hypothetical protein